MPRPDYSGVYSSEDDDDVHGWLVSKSLHIQLLPVFSRLLDRLMSIQLKEIKLSSCL